MNFIKTTALIAASIISGNLSAAIISTNSSTVIRGNTLDYDINADGINDFYLTSSIVKGDFIYVGGSNYYDATYTFTAGGYNGNRVSATTPLNAGDTVDASMNFSNNGLLLGSTIDYTGSYTSSCSGSIFGYSYSYPCEVATYTTTTSGNFPRVSYLGLEFNFEGETYYGWSRLNIAQMGTSGYLYNYAYESWTDEPILAGATINENTLQAQPVSAVPVPAAVWLFGSGLIGLFGFARKSRT